MYWSVAANVRGSARPLYASPSSSASLTTSTTRPRIEKSSFCMSSNWKITRAGERSHDGAGHSESGPSLSAGSPILS